MKITKSQLRHIIKEETLKVLNEEDNQGELSLTHREKGPRFVGTPEEAIKEYHRIEAEIDALVNDPDDLDTGKLNDKERAMFFKWQEEMEYYLNRYYELGGGEKEDPDF